MKEVHIIGKGSGWDLAPKEGETWGVNDIVLRRDQLAMCFHMHDLPWIKETNWRDEGFSIDMIHKKCQDLNIPLMSLREYKDMSQVIKYPLDEIVEKFHTNYFGSSIDLMFAYALYKEYEKINLYGVNMVIPGEYLNQKSSMEFWLGIAFGLRLTTGKPEVKVYAGKYSNVLKTFDGKIYGYNIDQFKQEWIY